MLYSQVHAKDIYIVILRVNFSLHPLLYLLIYLLIYLSFLVKNAQES